ncbi:hypothetical protein [uncultured Parvimonas sp.]|jgi:hypothetical protein|uniref:hypothetical protein n=1 Tax=uncultured Parvimonas sp. TaxID=747372 RepID=UPI001CAFB7E1|nr:hypothetical protein [uncultured Parvimonas sp.]MBF1037077.1 hypothetical protein [Parvimonas sp.]DAW31685.1 MAG TPA: hypothetical protein [Caudoviricetes sp.]
MVTTQEMKSCVGKKVKIYLINGKTLNVICDCYIQAEDEEDEPLLEFGNEIVVQSEIERIEILN